MASDYLINLIQGKYTFTRNEKAVVNSIFDGVLAKPAILFITNTKHATGAYRGWSVNATNFLISLIVSTHMVYWRSGRLRDSRTVKGFRLEKRGNHRGFKAC